MKKKKNGNSLGAIMKTKIDDKGDKNMANEKIVEIVEKNPQIAKVLFRSKLEKEEFLSIVEGLLKAKKYVLEEKEKSKKDELKIRIKSNSGDGDIVSESIMAIFRLKTEEDIKENLTLYHSYFDILIKDKEKEENCINLWKEQRNISWKIDDMLKDYFDLLEKFKQQCEKEEALENFRDFSKVLKDNIKKVQEIFSTIVNGNTIKKFVEFEAEIKENEQKNEVIKIETKKLGAMSKVKKDELMTMKKELNLYSYEDAMKIMKTIVKKYKQDIRFDPMMAKMQFKLGKEDLKAEVMQLEIGKLLEPSEVHPIYPYFPYEEKTEEEFFKELIKDLEIYHESEIENLSLQIQVEKKAKENNYEFKLEKTKKEKYEQLKVIFYEKMKECEEIKEDWFDKYGRCEYGKVVKAEKVKIDGEEYYLQDLYKTITIKDYEFEGNFRKLPEYFCYQGKMIEHEKKEEIGIGEMMRMIEYYLLNLKKENELMYLEKIKEIAMWYPANGGLKADKRSQLEQEIYVDILVEYIKNKEMDEHTAKFLIGENYVEHTKYWADLKILLKQEDDEFHELMYKKVSEQIKDKYKELTFNEVLTIMKGKCILNSEQQVKFLKEIKPTEMEAIIDFIKVGRENKIKESEKESDEIKTSEIMKVLYGK